MEKLEIQNQITATKLQIEDTKEQLSNEIQKSKPTLKLDFLTTKELVDSNDPVTAKATQDKIKKELKELNNLIKELWN
jgi:hypothetical protein